MRRVKLGGGGDMINERLPKIWYGGDYNPDQWLERAPVTGTVTLAAKAVMVLKE